MARRTKRSAGHDSGGGGGHGGASGRWLVSYSDFITLMFVVFVVMYSFAKVDQAKFGALADSLRASLGPRGTSVVPFASKALPGEAMVVMKPSQQGTVPPDWPARYIDPSVAWGRSIPKVELPPIDEDLPEPEPEPEPAPVVKPVWTPPPDPLKPMADVFANLPGTRAGILDSVLSDKGLELSVAGSVLFEPGQYRLKPEASALLDAIAANLQGVQSPILVEGAADEIATSAPGTFSPWDLAALRSGAVIQYLVARPGMATVEFVSINYRSGDSSQGPNRKVSIIVQR